MLEVGDGVCEVKSTRGDGFLGGDDFDEQITDWMVEEFLASSGVGIKEDVGAMQRVRAAAVTAKHAISERSEVPIKVPFLAFHDGRQHDLDLIISVLPFSTFALSCLNA